MPTKSEKKINFFLRTRHNQRSIRVMDVLGSILLLCLLLLAFPGSNYARIANKVVFTIANGNDIQCNGTLYLKNQLIVDQECSDEIYSKHLTSVRLKLPQTTTTTTTTPAAEAMANDLSIDSYESINQQPQATFTDSGGYMFQCNGFWLQNGNIFIIDQNCFEKIRFRSFLIIELNLTPQQTFVIRLPENARRLPPVGTVVGLHVNQGYSIMFRSIKFCSLTILIVSFIFYPS